VEQADAAAVKRQFRITRLHTRIRYAGTEQVSLHRSRVGVSDCSARTTDGHTGVILLAAITTAAMLLVSFTPLAFVPVPRPPVFVVTVVGLVAYWVLRHLRGLDRLEPAEWWAVGCYLLFLVYVTVTLVLRLRTLPRDPMLLPSLALYLPVMFLAFHAARAPAAVVVTTFVMAGTFVVAGLLGLATGTLIPDELGLSIFPPSDPHEVKATYQTEGLYLGSFLVISVCGACFARGLAARLTFAGLAMASLYLSLLSGSRATFIGSAVVALVVPLRGARAGHVALLAPLAAAIVLLWLAGPVELPKLEGLRTITRLEDVRSGDDSTMRGYLFSVAVRLFLTDGATVAFGAGIGEYDRTVGLVDLCCGTGAYYPHNFLLELLAEYGLVGTVLYLAPMILLLAARLRWPRGGRADPFRIACAGEMGLFWITGMGTGSLRLGWLVVFFSYVALALPPAREVARRASTVPAPGVSGEFVPGLVPEQASVPRVGL
jgi:O-antigen ligase